MAGCRVAAWRDTGPGDRVIRVGTSGWSYDEWAGTFYPPGLAKARWAEHYRRVFSTVEVNATFYRLPKPTMVQRWREEAPADFRYVTKGSRYLTHIRRLRDSTAGVRTYFDRVAELAPRLSAVLWQLPPNLERDVDLLETFLGALPRQLGPGFLRHAVEFRHRSWVTDEVFETLARHDAAHVWISSQAMPPDRTVTTDFVYVRFHGLAGGWRHDYSDQELWPWVETLVEVSEQGRSGFAFFNNDGAAHAPANALRFAELLGAHAHPWPPG